MPLITTHNIYDLKNIDIKLIKAVLEELNENKLKYVTFNSISNAYKKFHISNLEVKKCYMIVNKINN